MPAARGALYVATIGALSLIVRSLVIGPLPAWIPLGALAVYVLLVGAGVACLRLGMFVDVVWHGPRGARGVALTFDDGPSPDHTPRILQMLDDAGVKATFFVIGRKASAHPELVRAIASRGHAIGVHGYAHDRLTALRAAETTTDDISRAISAVEAITGERPALFRPPVGLTSPRVARALEWFELTVVGWTVRGADGWSGAAPERVAARVTRALRDGAIVLLHDSAERDDFAPASLDALPRILDAMRNQDLEGVPLTAWLGHAPVRPRRRDAGAPS